MIKVDVLDETGNLIISSEKNFVFPKNLNSDEDSILIIKGKDLPELDRNQIVSIVSTTKSNDRIKYTGAVVVSMDRQMNIKILQNNDTKVLEERRRYFKIKVDEKGRALFYVRSEKTVRFDEPVQISINDINVGGIFMKVADDSQEFLEDDLVCVELDLFVDYPLNAAVRILRVQRDSEGNINGYGCEFQGLTAAQEDYISKFIYKVQTEQRQKEAAMRGQL
ncbi:MAG: PilZ domain-containing protein [Oscillospiraceae bacterium]|nr:PilZ domain-containing protein [Oscillospiraceae bacterium]